MLTKAISVLLLALTFTPSISGGDCPLATAAAQGDADHVKYLIDAGYSPKEDECALLAAAMNNHADVVNLLLANGADVNAQRGGDLTALMATIAATSPALIPQNHEATVRALLSNGADVNIKSLKGWTALTYADWAGNAFAAKLIMDYGADVNAKDIDHRTPLMWAASQGSVEVVKELLARGADVKAEDLYGQTALMCARNPLTGNYNQDYPAIARLLKAAEASQKQHKDRQ